MLEETFLYARVLLVFDYFEDERYKIMLLWLGGSVDLYCEIRSVYRRNGTPVIAL